MSWRRERTLYLVKASNDYVSWCECEDAPIGLPRQESCPWCGCGWLFTCIHCRKAFTFARAVLLAEPLEDLARLQAPMVRRLLFPDGREIKNTIARTAADWCALMRPFLRGLELGKTYVYFDGAVVRTDAGTVRLAGKRRSHDIAFVPQVRALTDPGAADPILKSVDYWTEQDPD